MVSVVMIHYVIMLLARVNMTSSSKHLILFFPASEELC
jgi:hypothetical protein